MSGLLINLV